MAITRVSELIKLARDRRSQTEFAHELGVSQPTLCRYELGQTNPKTDVIEHCMRLVHLGDQKKELSVDELANKMRAHLGGEDLAPLRVMLSKMIDDLVANINVTCHARKLK